MWSTGYSAGRVCGPASTTSGGFSPGGWERRVRVRGGLGTLLGPEETGVCVWWPLDRGTAASSFIGWGCGGPGCFLRTAQWTRASLVSDAAFGFGRGLLISSAICFDRFVCSSFLGHTVDALASGADEGRGSLRYASGSRQPDFDPGISEWGNLAPVMGCRRRLNV
jgi:hypothetical protein